MKFVRKNHLKIIFNLINKIKKKFLILLIFLLCYIINFQTNVTLKNLLTVNAADVINLNLKTQNRNGFFTTTAYDQKEKETPYINTSSTGYTFKSSIAYGASVNNPVKFVIPSNMQYKLFKDDKEITYTSGNFTQAKDYGYFELRIISPSGSTSQQVEESFTFKIIQKTLASQLSMINAPVGFYISSIRIVPLNSSKDYDTSETTAMKLEKSEEIYSNSPDFYKMEKNGIYFFDFVSQFNRNINFDVEILKMDDTSDLLTVTGVKNQKAIQDVVTFSTKEGAETVVRKNGEIIKNDGKIKEPGEYLISATDKAGNSVEYSFIYKYRPSGTTYVLIIILVLILILFPLYISRLKTLIKIR